MASSLSLLILTLSLLSTTTTTTAQQQPPSSASILNAADTLANSGYTSMSFTLQLIAPTLPTTLTVFSPPDTSFANSGQPSLSHLLLHFSPLSLSPSSLLSLPFASTIPSLSPSKHLTITSTTDNHNSNGVLISINNVTISQSPIYDDGFVLVYGIDDFFNYNFTLGATTAAGVNSTRVSDLQCSKLERLSIYGDASGVLKSRGYSIMGSFLDLQLMGFLGRRDDDDVKWSVFAPVDAELVGFSGDFLGYSSLFMRHLVPCRVRWADLDEMVNGTQVSKNVDGFSLEITRDDEMLMVNGVEITNPDMYETERLVVHGIRGVIPLPENAEEFPDDKDEASTDLDRGEF